MDQAEKKTVSGGVIVAIVLGAMLVLCLGGAVATAIIRGPVTTTTQVAAPEQTAPATSTPSTAVETTTTTPSYTVSEDNGMSVTVLVTSADPEYLRTVFEMVRSDIGGDSRQVFIDCSSGTTSASANRLAVGAYATTDRGRVQTGLYDTDTRFEVNAGRTCP